MRASANADCGCGLHRLCDAGCRFGGRHFYDHHGGTSLLKRQRISQHNASGILALALHPIAAQLMHRLRCQTNMCAHRNAPLGEKAYGLGHIGAALNLHHLRASGHQFGGIMQRLLWAFLIRAKRHISDEEGALHAAKHTLRVINHILQPHRQSGGMALNHITQRIAHKHHIDTAAIEHGGKARIIAGEHGNLLAAAAQLGDVTQFEWLGLFEIGHNCSSLSPTPLYYQ